MRNCLAVVVLLVCLNNATAGVWTTLDYPGATATYLQGISGSNMVGWENGAPNGSHGFLYDGTN